MKKFIAIVMALMLALSLAAFAAAESEEEMDYGKAHPESLVFDSEWVSAEANAKIYCEDGGFKISITQNQTWPEAFMWEYSCLYHEDTKTLVSMGFDTKYRITYEASGQGGFEISETLYEDGAATFSINDQGKLIWKDEKEDAGKGIEFTKIGWFNDTSWVCDRANIEIAWQDEGYKVFVQWGNSATESSEWDYSCYYDAATNSLTSLAIATRSELTYNEDGTVASWVDVYTDGSATFKLDADGHLLWQDNKEDAGKDMVFERVDDVK